jgi:hypothetical protein
MGKGRFFVATALLGVATLVEVGPAAADGQRPPGNNGTIKVTSSAPVDDKANEPHLVCDAYVQLWGYDAGSQTAELTFTAKAPTAGGVVHEGSVSWTTATREGGQHLDATYGPVALADAFAAAGIAPAAQGYHVELTAHVTGSQGSDVKHKVFWIEPCGSEAGPAAAPGEVTTTTSTTATTVAPAATTSTTATTAAPTTSDPAATGGATPTPVVPATTTPAATGGTAEPTQTTDAGGTSGGTTTNSGGAGGTDFDAFCQENPGAC